ncbi:MAG: DoxX family membrane protein [Planctomycetota bacterium]|nr:DoxX family membrane protein [Planctomycetota bacterium]
MQIKTLAGTSLVPILSRLVLGVTFLLNGWFFCFQTIEYSPGDTARLQEMRSVDGQAAEAADSEGSSELAVNRLMLHMEGWNLGHWAQPASWLIAIFQLIAGAALIFGIFIRLLALGICLIIAAAIWSISIKQNGMLDMNPLSWRLHPGAWYTLTSQLGLFVLAFGLVFTGGGPFCIERLIWRNGAAAPKKKSAGAD